MCCQRLLRIKTFITAQRKVGIETPVQILRPVPFAFTAEPCARIWPVINMATEMICCSEIEHVRSWKVAINHDQLTCQAV